MSKKTLLILCALVAIFAAVWGVGEMASRKQAGKVKALSIEVLKGIDSLQANEVEIVKSEENVVLKREGEKWMVEEREADAEKVKSALEAVKNASFTGPVARNEENHDKLGVGGGGMKVIVRQGDARFEFRIGGSGPTFDSSYVRLESETDVYLADVNLGFKFNTREDSWREKQEPDETPREETDK